MFTPGFEGRTFLNVMGTFSRNCEDMILSKLSVTPESFVMKDTTDCRTSYKNRAETCSYEFYN